MVSADRQRDSAASVAGRLRVLSLVVLVEGAVLLLAWLLGRIIGPPALGGLDPTPATTALGLAATLPPLLTLAWALRSSWSPLARTTAQVRQVVHRLFARCGWFELALIAAWAGIAEEALFRGFVQRYLGDATHPAIGLLLAGVLFGAVHAVSITYATYATLVGIYLGALLLWFDNLWVPVVVHVAYDFVALVALSRTSRARAFSRRL